MAEKSISQLDTAPSANVGDLFVLSAPDQSSASGYKTYKLSLAALADFVATNIVFTGMQTTAKSIIGAVNELRGVILTGTLTAGSTTLTLQDVAITANSTFDIYTDTYGVNPVDVVASVGEVVLTFPAQSAAVGVKVRVS